MQSFHEPRQITVSVNDTPIGTVTVNQDTLSRHTFNIPAALIGSGQHVTIMLDYDAVIVPADIGQSADPRRLAVAVESVRFDAVP